MQAPELTFEAALRDADATRLEARHRAVRSLAPALLVEIDRPGPLWRAADAHVRGREATEALFTALNQREDVALAALGAIGLGMLGAPDVLDVLDDWVARDGHDEPSSFLRECAVIATGYVGVAANGANGSEAETVRIRVVNRLRGWFESAFPDIRFQATLALVDVEGTAVEPQLASALRAEDHPEVREGLVDALSRLEHISKASIRSLCDVLDDDEDGPGPLGFEAAMVLAGSRDRTAQRAAGPRLLRALAVRHQRDRALEALAVLADRAPTHATRRVHALARGLLTPGVTRVRAAYALARLPGGASRGLSLLRMLRWHPSQAVREALHDARANLQQLAVEPPLDART